MPKLKNTPEQELTVHFKIAISGKGWTQRHFAEICKIDEAEMSRIINKPSKCRYSTLCLVADKLGINSLPVI